jgi:hypothetical protein
MTGGNDGNIETAIPKRVFNEALYRYRHRDGCEASIERPGIAAGPFIFF